MTKKKDELQRSFDFNFSDNVQNNKIQECSKKNNTTAQILTFKKKDKSSGVWDRIINDWAGHIN
jgi:hypothetical protein